ncbi:hypothetical protein JTE90_013529 [Oedothorax gibbosus]|uniref:Ionotropic glutamate receptor L-glutamate and glycine-binding domain-containing protein n=1 Tax=Oedothorax gibbosus TaxID=931172 RepID=A0AAV6U8J1_9ARAC|nr:hypothetical protein JTE90_013529 [Oedothorax gibbosus]
MRSPSLVVAVMAAKFIIELNTTQDSRLELSGGCEGLFLRDLLQGLGLEYRVVTPVDRNYGFLLPNGSWTGLIGMVHRDEADLAMGGLVITEKRLRYVDFSVPYNINPLTFAIGRPKLEPLKNAYIYPFKIVVWGCSLGLIIAMSASLYLMFYRKHSILTMFLEVFATTLRQPFQFVPDSSTLKAFLSLWLLCAFVLSSSYSGALLSFLLLPTQSKIPENFFELSEAVDKGTVESYVIRGGITEFILNDASQDHLKVISTAIEKNSWYLDVTNIQKQSSLVTESEKVAFISGRFGLKLSLSKLSQQPKVFISNDVIAELHLGVAFGRNFCCKKKLNKIINRLLSAGLLEKYFNDVFFRKGLLDMREEHPIDEQEVQITLEEISGIFLLLLIGYALAFVAFLGEICFDKYNRKYNER